MDTKQTSNRIHPLVAVAAVAVTLASLTGVAAMTGLFPSSHSDSATAPPLASTSAAVATMPVAPPVAAPLAPSANAPKPANNQVANKAPAVRPAPAKPRPSPASQQQPMQAAICGNCGRVESIQAVQHAAPASGLGVAAGAVVGGLLGNQVGGGNGRTLATVAGAVGGGFAGNEVEKRTRTNTSYEVRVRMENGTLQSFPQSNPNGWQVGDPVRVVNGALSARG